MPKRVRTVLTYILTILLFSIFSCRPTKSVSCDAIVQRPANVSIGFFEYCYVVVKLSTGNNSIMVDSPFSKCVTLTRIGDHVKIRYYPRSEFGNYIE